MGCGINSGNSSKLIVPMNLNAPLEKDKEISKGF